MNCKWVKSRISEYVDTSLPERERQVLAAHLARCLDCLRECEDLRYVRTRLSELPAAVSPKTLVSRLRVMASYEQARLQGAPEFSSPVRVWWMRAKLWARDLMRPLALPAAGGVLSSILFFSMLVDTFAFQLPAQSDIPLGVYTQATVDLLSPYPFGLTGHDVTVELIIDKNGHVTNYLVPTGTVTRDDLRELGNLILFTSFNPAKSYGQPTAGKIMLKSVRINVRG